MDEAHDLGRICEQLGELRMDNDTLRVKVRELETLLSPARPNDAGTDEPVSRRQLLRRVGGAAATGAALAIGAGTLVSDEATAAVDGPLILGRDNDAVANTTELHTAIGNGNPAFIVRNTGVGDGIQVGAGGSGYRAVYGRNGAGSGITLTGGVVGDSNTGDPGVVGTSSSGYGVRGVLGGELIDLFAPNAGVRGEGTDSGQHVVGVFGISNGVGVEASGGFAPLHLRPAATVGPPTGGLVGTVRGALIGDIYVDGSGALFQCVRDSQPILGTPFKDSGGWVRVGFNPITPRRIADTRSGATIPANPYKGMHLAATNPNSETDTLTVTVTGNLATTTEQVFVPAQASAVVLNVTATNIGAEGYLSVFPADSDFPGVSNVNFPNPSQTFLPAIPNQVTVRVGAGGDNAGKVKIFNGSAAPIDVIVDLAGFFS